MKKIFLSFLVLMLLIHVSLFSLIFYLLSDYHQYYFLFLFLIISTHLRTLNNAQSVCFLLLFLFCVTVTRYYRN